MELHAADIMEVQEEALNMKDLNPQPLKGPIQLLFGQILPAP